MRQVTLEKMILDKMEELGKMLPSKTAGILRSCSDDLANENLVSSAEEFEITINGEKYRLLPNYLKQAGLSNTDFKEIIENLKKEYFK